MKLPAWLRIRRKRRPITRPEQACIRRFGILAARDTIERWRLTDDQTDYLEGHYGVGWRKEDAWSAYRREACKAAGRVLLSANGP